MDLKYDPRTKAEIKDLLYRFIYQPVIARFAKRLQLLVLKNNAAVSMNAAGFLYQGELYGKVARGVRTPQLDKQLHAEMKQYLADQEKLNKVELPYVMGFLNQVLNSSEDLQDYLRVLPPSIHQPITDLIAKCGCRTTKLTAEEVERLKQANNLPIELLKQRLVLNLVE